jgi:hypothetical protein
VIRSRPRVKPRHKLGIIATLVAVTLAFPIGANAWDAVGHETIARIAWDRMTPAARAKAVALLRAAPPLSGIRDLELDATHAQAVRDRELFVRAAVWADLVRDRNSPERRDRFHRTTWHYRDFFWEQRDTTSRLIDRPDITPDDSNAIERLGAFRKSVGDAARADSLRAIDLAWILHLVGDIHQPLHTSGRVTPDEPKGDAGGNTFRLDSAGRNTLHGFWDGIITRTDPRGAQESEQAYVARLSTRIAAAHPARPMASTMKPDQFEAWALEGVATTKRELYPKSLLRGQPPSAAYTKRATQISEAAIARAGYRLADLLNRALK